MPLAWHVPESGAKRSREEAERALTAYPESVGSRSRMNRPDISELYLSFLAGSRPAGNRRAPLPARGGLDFGWKSLPEKPAFLFFPAFSFLCALMIALT
ncbi:hypothetical protein [Streptomyces griseoluteus]|uniref:hypothetical protein n=1 Tax=Streptomyces griseoluteus TaxID=29306 RepID=UPI00364F5E93